MSELAREVGAADITKDRLRIRFILQTAAVAAIYFVAGKLGLQFAVVHASATAVWPPTGIALAAALVFGPRVAPGVFLGAFLTNATTAVPLGAALGIAGGNTIEALLGAFLVNRYAGGRRAFDHAPNVFRFVALGALVATTTSATIGVLTLCLSGSAPWQAFGSVWLTWWFGDAMGALLFTPFLLAWNAGERVVWTRAKVLEAAAVLTLLLLAGALMSGFLSDRVSATRRSDSRLFLSCFGQPSVSAREKRSAHPSSCSPSIWPASSPVMASSSAVRRTHR